MQFIVISHQLWETLGAAILGVFLGFSYDIVRFFRRLLSFVKAEVFLSNVFDVVFSIFAGCAYCVYVYYASYGHFRWFTALAVVLGFVLYRLFPSKLIFPVFVFLANAVFRVFWLIAFPFHKLFGFYVGICRKCFKRVKIHHMVRRTIKMKKQLYNDVRL